MRLQRDEVTLLRYREHNRGGGDDSCCHLISHSRFHQTAAQDIFSGNRATKVFRKRGSRII